MEGNLLNVVPGTWFRAAIRRTTVVGQIQIELKEDKYVVFLCQGQREGDRTKERFGWKYSWNVGDGDPEMLHSYGVTNLELLTERPADVFMPITVTLNENYFAEVKPGYVQVGCQCILNSTIRELVAKLVDVPEKQHA